MLPFDGGGGDDGSINTTAVTALHNLGSKHSQSVTANNCTVVSTERTRRLHSKSSGNTTSVTPSLVTVMYSKRTRRKAGGRRSLFPTTAAASLVLVLLAMTSRGAVAKGTYTVLAPAVLRPNRDYSAVVSTHNTDGPLRLAVEITGNLERGGANGQDSAFQTRQEAVLQPDSSQLVKFQMGDLNRGDYHLSVSGTGGGLEFRNITSLRFEPKSFSVFVETDRAAYKPGDLVRFRVVLVNPNLRPSVTGAIDVDVQDGSGTSVRRFPRVFTVKGVWTGEVRLAREPVLGQWTVVVTVLGQEYKGEFFVLEFVDPKFEVSMDVPRSLALDDDQMTVIVDASYPYGLPITGEVTLQVTPRYKYEYLQAPYTPPTSIVRPIRGRAVISLSLTRDLGLRGDYSRELEVTAYVMEQLTERVQNATVSTTVWRYPYRLTFVRSSDTFKPGLKYTAYLLVAYQDGRPVTSGDVYVRHAFVRDESAFVETRHSIPPSGRVVLELFPPLHPPAGLSTFTLALEARYLNLTQWLGEVEAAQSPAGAFLQATLLTPQPQVGSEVIVALNATEPLLYFVYEALARGVTLHGSTLQARRGTTHTFRFVAGSSMYPRARLLVYYVRDDGEVVADALHFGVDRNPKDKVTLSITPLRADTSSPNGRVSITVSARPNSLVGVAAMDSSSLAIAGDEYQMDQTDIMKELESYDPGRHDAWQPTERRHRGLLLRRMRRTALRKGVAGYGAATAHDVFENAGVVVITNAKVHRQEPLESGVFLPGLGPIDGRGWDPSLLPPAQNGPFGRLPVATGPHASTLRPDLGPGLVYDPSPRPPLAGPYAFSFFPPPPDNKPRLYLPRALPPTWVFVHRQTGLNGILTWQERLPKALASYTFTAFAIDDFDGLTIAETPVTVTTYRPFYVTVRVPPSVVRGEAVAVEVVVFNYTPDNTSATVTLQNPDGDFLFPDFSNEIDQGSPAADQSRQVTIPSGGRAPLSFMIVPRRLGAVTIRVGAAGGGGSLTDTTTRVLRVKAEGHRLHVNKALYLDPSTSSSSSSSLYVLNITLPRNIVRDTLHVEVSALGDVFGGPVTSLQQLLPSLPAGCGEQNTAAMVPVMLSMEHLERAGELSTSLREKSVAELQLRLQQQLTFRQTDGSFAFFDEYRPAQGSVWLTGFVCKTLRHVSRHTHVPRHVITSALAWLVRQQQPDGSFAELPDPSDDLPSLPPSSADRSTKGRRNDSVVLTDGNTDGPSESERLQGDTVGRRDGAVSNATKKAATASRQSPVVLTSFVLLAILEVEDYSSVAVRNAGNRALEYLVGALQLQEASQDLYGLSVATYALHVAGHPYRDTAFYMLEAMATVEGDEKYWLGPSVQSFDSTEEGNIVSSFTVEQTAYCLLTYTRRSLAVDSAPVARWLVRHRNHRGGFSTSQDTAVGLSALSALAELQSSASSGGGQQQPNTVRIVYGERGHRFVVSADNARTLQRLQLPADTRSVEISSSGSRPAIVQLSYSYNVQVTAPRPAFSLDPQLDRTTDSNRLRLTSCTGLLSRNGNGNDSSNMAVMEVHLPSGYVIDTAALPGLYDYPGVKRVERLRQVPEALGRDEEEEQQQQRPVQGGLDEEVDDAEPSGVAIYFSRITSREVCPTISASRINRVAFQKPTVVRVYDYYDLTRQARQFYDAAPATLCDICDIDECDSGACDVQILELNRQRQDPDDVGYPASIVETSRAGLPAPPLLTSMMAAALLLVLH